MKGVGLSTRGTFLRKSGPPQDPDRLHLHIICTNEDEFGLMLVVPLCSLEPSTTDRACLLGIGDHPFINRRSFIHYSKAEILERSSLQESLRRSDIIPHDDCRDDIFQKILHGLTVSKAIRPKKKRYYEASTKPIAKAA